MGRCGLGGCVVLKALVGLLGLGLKGLGFRV